MPSDILGISIEGRVSVKVLVVIGGLVNMMDTMDMMDMMGTNGTRSRT